jgi:MOSC domain-containing protein YiiM
MDKANYPKRIFTGTVAQRYGLETAIDKSPIDQPLYLSYEGLEGDQCADAHHHGGLERALHQYPLEHYAFWQERYGAEIAWLAPGMGENISSIGMTEENVYLGDRYQWGDSIIEISQPRSPCFKLNKRWEIVNFAQSMQDLSRCGWLYRVIQPGAVFVDSPLILLEREQNAMTIAEVCHHFFTHPLSQDGLIKLKRQKKLSSSWMAKVDARLASKAVENWNFRLFGRNDITEN